MSVESNTRTEIVSTLTNGVLAISDCIIALYNAGYIPSKRKYHRLECCNILLNSVKDDYLMTNEDKEKLLMLCDKIIMVWNLQM